jgi:hypothetical protein
MPAASNYDLPDNILEFLNESQPSGALEPFGYKVHDAGALVAIQKSAELDFVPPLDINTGMWTDNESLKQRYWTVFDPEALDRLIIATASRAKRP